MGGGSLIRRCGHGLLSLLYPRRCLVCGDPLVGSERHICLSCLAIMPRPYFSGTDVEQMSLRLGLTVAPEHTAALFIYGRRDPYAALIHHAKYRDKPEVGRYLASILTGEILPSGFFGSVDLVVPVPLHWFKRVRRGYNQTEYIARGVADVTGIPCDNAILKVRAHRSQTRRSASSRAAVAANVFALADDVSGLEHCHILLVDDVLTTGSTLRGCAAAIRTRFPSVRLSVLTLAVTD